MRKRQTYGLPVFLLFCAPLFGQQPSASGAPTNPLSAGEKGFYNTVSGSVVAAAEKMPEENYSFKPTPEVRSFGQLVGHVADAQFMFCSNITGEKSPGPNAEKTKASKADLVQALKDGVDYCKKAYGSMTDAQASEMTQMFGRPMPKLLVLTINTAHADEHYGNMVTYLRLKNIVPPTSETRK